MPELRPPLPPKREVCVALLEGTSIFVHLDPRKDAVVVPPWFKRQPQLVLQIGRNMAVPIPDLEVGAEGIACTLSFSRSPFKCFLPWDAIYALVSENNRGMVWPTDVPPEVSAQVQRSMQQAKQPPTPAAASTTASAQPAPAPSPSPAASESADAPKKKKSRPALSAIDGGAPAHSKSQAGDEGQSPLRLAESQSDESELPSVKSSDPKPVSPVSPNVSEPAKTDEVAASADTSTGAEPPPTPEVSRAVATGKEVATGEDKGADEKTTPTEVKQSLAEETTEQPAENQPLTTEEIVETEPTRPARGKRELPPYLRVIK